jgi:hypothetical protein
MDIKFEDLAVKCSECGGAGQIESVPPPQGGYGSKMVYSSPKQCNVCYGSGWQLTESGKAIGKLFKLIDSNVYLKQTLFPGG